MTTASIVFWALAAILGLYGLEAKKDAKAAVLTALAAGLAFGFLFAHIILTPL